MAQVHNRVNAGVMDGVVYGGMMEAAEPEDEEYEIGMEEDGLEPYGHVVNESNDCVKFDGYYFDCYDHDAVPFISFIKKDGSRTKMFVGENGELHSTMPAALLSNGDIRKDDFGSLWNIKKDEERSGRVWITENCTIISFYSYPQSPKKIYDYCVEALLAVQKATDTDFNIGEVMVDLWTKNVRNPIIMPVRWFNNGMAEMFLPIVEKCEPYESFDGEFKYKLSTSKGNFTADWKGDDIEQEQGYVALNELTTDKNKKTMYITEEQLKQIKVLSEEKGESVDYNKYIKSLIEFMREQHLRIDPLPEIELNPEEQDGIFVKTGYYSPEEHKVVVFTDGRHPKDVLRTVAHEFVHHMQNLQNPNKDWGTGGDLEADSKLRSIEGEAFLLGNIIFREWTEKMKKTKELNESTQGGANLDEFWNGDGNEMDFTYPENVPDKLYHLSPIKNRESILKNGLMPSVGDEYYDWWSYDGPNGEYDDLSDMPELVFLTDNPNTWLECLGGFGYDLYEIDTNKLDKEDISLDPTPSLANRGCYCYGQIIPPSAIKLIKTIESEQCAALNETRKQRKNDKGEIVPETCDKCGGKVVCQIHGEPVYVCKDCGKYFGTMPFNLNEAFDFKKALRNLKKRRDPDGIEDWNRLDEIEAEIVEPDDVDLSSFNIKKHLNPKFWDDGHLDTRIRLKLLDIADDFFNSLDVDWVEPEDIIITGSIANYNWNKKYSDIDLHILVDYEDVDERVDFVREYFTLKKNAWNEKHKNLRIFGFPVEVYVQDANEPHASSGVYSIDKDKWLTEPDLDNLRSGKVNKKHVRETVSTYMNKIDCLIDIYKKHKDDEYEMEKVAKDAAEMFDEIKKMRKDDLGKYGREMCDGNIIFKALRRSDYIGKLLKLRDLTYDKINSL